jgi:hypothetical protein
MAATKKADQLAINKRRYTRFKTDKNSLAWFSFEKTKSKFKKDVVGLVTDLSYKGCGVVVFEHQFKIDQFCYIKAGPIPTVLGKVVWIKALEEGIYKVGIQFLE